MKRTWVREIFLKIIEQGIYHNLLQEIVSMIENNISDNLYNELFTKSSEEKFMAWSLIVHKNTIKNCSTVLQVFSSHPLSLHVSFVLFFMEARIFLQFLSQAFIILYMFPSFSFVFINILITST